MQAETSKWVEQKRKKTLKQDTKEGKREDKRKQKTGIWIRVHSQTFNK